MKKNLLVFAIILSLGLIHNSTYAQSSDICTEGQYAAVSPSGTCEEFNNSCDIPQNWKKLDTTSTCSEVQEKSFGQRIDQVLERRLSGLKNLSSEIESPQEGIQEQLIRKRQSIRRFTGANANRRFQRSRQNVEKPLTDFSKQRTSTNRFRGTSTYVKQNLSKQQREAIIKKQQTKRRTHRLSNASGAIRTGALSNKARWNVQSRQHFSRGTRNYKAPRWKSNSQLIKERISKNRAAFAKKRLGNRKLGLKRTFRGEIERNFGDNFILQQQEAQLQERLSK